MRLRMVPLQIYSFDGCILYLLCFDFHMQQMFGLLDERYFILAQISISTVHCARAWSDRFQIFGIGLTVHVPHGSDLLCYVAIGSVASFFQVLGFALFHQAQDWLSVVSLHGYSWFLSLVHRSFMSVWWLFFCHVLAFLLWLSRRYVYVFTVSLVSKM